MPLHEHYHQTGRKSRKDMPKPAELQLAMAPLFLIPELANLRPSLVSFALQLLLHLQEKNLKNVNEWQRCMYV